MKKPRDSLVADRVGGVRVARTLSNVVSPPTMFAATAVALGTYERPIWPGLAWGALVGFIVSIVPMLVIVFSLYTGRIEDIHMSNTSERHIPYLIGTMASLLGLAVVLIFGGPELLMCLTLFNVIALASLGLINTRWLISIHATAASACWLIATLVFGWVVGLVLLPVALAVIYARYYLRRHTVTQLVAGISLGVGIVLVLRVLGCFVV